MSAFLPSNRAGSLSAAAIARQILVVFAAIGLGCTSGGEGNGGGAGVGTGDGVAGVDTAVTGSDTAATTDTTGADAAAVDADGAGSGSDAVDTAAGTDDTSPIDTATGTDAVVPDDSADGGTDAATAEVATGCKEAKDCPAATEPCTVATCDAATGQCGTKSADDGATCDDTNACTADDKCAVGKCGGINKDCDDNNACTDDTCDPAKGCVNANNAIQCSDNNVCTLADVCKDGKCAPGEVDKCDDGNPCTDDNCDVTDAEKGTKGCIHKNNTAACQDGSACTSGDLCAVGICNAGTPTDCDDKNACTVDACDTKTGCGHTPAADASTCDDGDTCTVNESCSAGKCTGKALDCNDKNACTKDSCDKVAGCLNSKDVTDTCDDDNSCTSGDVCKLGVCKGIGKICADDNNPCTDEGCAENVCSSTPNAAPCDDGNPCTQKDVCKDSKCGGGVPIACDDKNDCTTDACDSVSGLCKSVDNANKCDDGSACTSADSCQSGMCVGAPVKCDDGKICTLDSCDDNTGKCQTVNYADATVCDDDTVCTQNDECKAGVCAGQKIPLDDGNPCTDDKCDPAKGVNNVANTAKCEDGDKCTLGDVCKDKLCTSGLTLDKCDDANPCTDGSCDKGLGCVQTNNAANCDDKDQCTDTDICKAGSCVGKAKVCDDGLVCTNDSCDKAKGCLVANNTLTCNDNNVCTTGDICAGGKCAGKAAAACDDKNACTTDACDPKLGCVYKPTAAGGACDDGSGCTTGDNCDGGGKCTGIGKNCDDANTCTTDSCANNICSYADNKLPCDDGDKCTLGDTCNGAKLCVGPNKVICDDSNPCTDDSCATTTGCINANNTVGCDDGNFCTDKDTCGNGKCSLTVPHPCDDANVCTNDSCDAVAKKCAAAANTAVCDDGNKCSTPDKCANSACAAGPQINCDDSNPCTLDSCDKVTAACLHLLTADALVCPSFGIPSIWAINFGDPLWVAAGAGANNVKFATDANGLPGQLTGGASLNVNNGTNFDGGTLNISGLGKYFIDATKFTGTQMTYLFYSWSDVESGGFDQLFVEFSTDGFQNVTLGYKLSKAVQKTWVLEAFNVNALIGKKFQVRFRIATGDSAVNGGAGWFIDEANVYGGPIIALTPTTWASETFNNNNNGWQFTPANANKTGWAIDATADIAAAAVTAPNKMSLNMNNGLDFSGLAQGSAFAPVIDLTNAGTGPVTLMFKEWVQSETGFYDRRFVEASGDAFVTLPITVQQTSSAVAQNNWRWASVDLSALKGKKVVLRFRFDSIDAGSNSGKGWFVDDLTLDTAPLPSYVESVTCSNPAAFTISNFNAVGWAIDANAGDMAYSAACSLNLSTLSGTLYNFVCPAGTTKVGGTAKTGAFVVKASPTVGAKTWLKFKAYFDGEGGTVYDALTLTIQDTATTVVATPMDIAKTNITGKWGEVAIDMTPYNGKTVTLGFSFDSKDCFSNSGKGIFIDDIMVRADK